MCVWVCTCVSVSLTDGPFLAQRKCWKCELFIGLYIIYSKSIATCPRLRSSGTIKQKLSRVTLSQSTMVEIEAYCSTHAGQSHVMFAYIEGVLPEHTTHRDIETIYCGYRRRSKRGWSDRATSKASIRHKSLQQKEGNASSGFHMRRLSSRVEVWIQALSSVDGDVDGRDVAATTSSS